VGVGQLGDALEVRDFQFGVADRLQVDEARLVIDVWLEVLRFSALDEMYLDVETTQALREQDVRAAVKRR